MQSVTPETACRESGAKLKRMNITHRISRSSPARCFRSPFQARAIDQLHDFLKNTKTLKADFAQAVIAKNGRKSRSNRRRVGHHRGTRQAALEIQKPLPQLVVGDGENPGFTIPNCSR